ncbi:caspase family protein [Actinokineospora globicatena]|uniref:Peptidase C14 caspase domain-containing protein n=1 Tax=Actinokineospora globicatena TaxID=103729 RepID=A0A9W6QP38_9PSEU|nr:caspase family protein [Actinokineospora globicatena]GLW93968.1 hypothetical protein Aglo03_47840 [Actinokineospora globicatena]
MPGKSRAVLIGTSTYSDDGLPDIPQVGPGLAQLGRLFTDLGLVQGCDLLLDQPSVPTLGRGLRAAMDQAEDLLLVYYIGHGLIGRQHELYLGMRDSEVDHPDFGSLSYTSLRERVLDSPATVKIVILDCCFSGRALGSALAAPVDELAIDGTYLMTSAARDKVSLVLPGEEYTAFTGRFLRLLTNGIPGHGDHVTIDEVYRELLRIMTAGNLPRPQKRGTRTADQFRIPNRAAVISPEYLREQVNAVVAKARAEGWAAAVDALVELHDRQVDTLPADAPDVLRTRSHVLFARAAAGGAKAAATDLAALLTTQVTAQGEHHPDSLRTRHYLAICVGESESPAAAVPLLRLLTPVQRTVLGYDDEDTCRTQHALGRYLFRSGEREEAAVVLAEVLAVRERVLAAADPLLAQTRRDLDLVRGSGG